MRHRRCPGPAPAGLLLLPLLLSGCFSLPGLPDNTPDNTSAHPAIESTWHSHPFYQLEGRFALRYPHPDRPLESGANQQASGRFSWQHSPEHDRLLLSDPLGRGIAAIDRRPGLARLTAANGEEHLASDADSLIRQISGLPLPVNALADWLGNRNPHGDRIDLLPDGRPSRRHSQGWWIDYSYVDGTVTPRRITARWGEDIELRLAIESWQDTTDTPSDD